MNNTKIITKKFISLAVTAIIGLSILTGNLFAQVQVSGYYKSNGTYVKPHLRTAPDSSPYNNYSFPGNYNPNTSKITTGSKSSYLNSYYKSSSSSSKNKSSKKTSSTSIWDW